VAAAELAGDFINGVWMDLEGGREYIDDSSEKRVKTAIP
jgi:hypothetical protein